MIWHSYCGYKNVSEAPTPKKYSESFLAVSDFSQSCICRMYHTSLFGKSTYLFIVGSYVSSASNATFVLNHAAA